MHQAAPGYMHWAKTHPRARFELTGSGVPPAGFEDLGGLGPQGDLEIQGAYGDPDLIEAIAAFRGVAADRVLPVLGASTANFLALACSASSGDPVLIETPVYDPLVRAARFLNLLPVPFARQPDRHHRPDLDAVGRGLAGGAKAVILTNLHNPSGLRCPDEDLQRLAGMTADHGANLIIDEVFLDFAVVNAGQARPGAATRGELGSHVIITDSLTKVYGLGGLRAGWMIAHPHLLPRAGEILDLLNVVNPVVSARLATLAIENAARLAERCRRIYDAGYPVYTSWLASRDDLTAYGNDGALFSWLRLEHGVDADQLAALLAERYETHVVSGSFFGSNQHVRIGFSLPTGELAEALDRVGAALEELHHR